VIALGVGFRNPGGSGCPATMKLAGRRQARWPVG
jgi:hypothetical protein